MENSILEQLKAKKINVSVLCSVLKVSRGAVYNSINGNGSRYIRVLIANLLDKKPSELWYENELKVAMLDDALFSIKHHTTMQLINNVNRKIRLTEIARR